jgi:hypothetical protein
MKICPVLQKSSLVVLVIFLFFAVDLHAWCPSAHKVIAEIAYQRLDSEAKEKIDLLVKNFESFYPGHSSFINAATWADDIRAKEGLRIFDTLHFTNLPYDPESILSPQDLSSISGQSRGSDALWFVQKAVETLNNKTASPFAKTLVLYLLIHVVSDLHQPFHCCTKYSKNHPTGDAGGNLYPVKTSIAKNVHQLWDSGAGFFPLFDSQQSPNRSAEVVSSLAVSVTEQFSEENLPEANILEVKEWSIESQKIDISVGYQACENEEPSSDYLKTVQETTTKRVALAGYRLAKLLNKIFSTQETA